jgi:hypothetical protein
MSWIKEELRRRALAAPQAQPLPSAEMSESSKVADLWSLITGANNALPVELQLELIKMSAFTDSGQDHSFSERLSATNGAFLGFADSYLFYFCHESGVSRSNNFWIRWNLRRNLYLAIQRTSNYPVTFSEFRFDPTRIDYIIKCLVQGVRIESRLLRKMRLLLF